jgi:hypothetical protein
MLNRKGQFSVIAALLVAVVLVASVVTTYSAIRYNPVPEQPQILNAVDETNLGLKEILGFTVGYYGSVLKVTGNQTYANQLARTYMQSGLDQTGDVRPDWGAQVNLTSLDLKTNWFSNESYSQGNMTVTYNLEGLGIYGASYSTSTRLDVEISKGNQTNQAQLKILMDDGQPLINLGKNNLKLYRYVYNVSDWDLVEPANIASYADGTYVLDLPQGVNGSSYVIQVEDTRGLMVLASSFSQFNSKLTWNSSSFQTGFDYVDNNSLNAIGTHSNFAAQQNAPDGVYDNLTETASGTTYVPSYPTNYNLYGSTTLASGSTGNLQVNDGVYMSFHSYGSSFGGSANFGYTTKGATSSGCTYDRGSRFTMGTSNGLGNSISAYLGFTAANANFGNTNAGSVGGQSIVDTIRGQRFTSPASPVVAQNIVAYIDPTSSFGDATQEGSTANIKDEIRGSAFTANQTGTIQSITADISISGSAKNMKAALYTDGTHTLIGQTQQQSVSSSGWTTFTFATAQSVTSGTSYVLVVWSAS